jgi:hypothetical protein
MKHLTDEERLAFVEGRASKESSDHIDQCAECAAQVQAFRRSIKRLEELEWPARVPQRATIHAPIFKLALAASIVLCVGFALGRFTGPNPAEIQAAVKAELSHDVQQQLAAALHERPTPEIDMNTIFTLLADLRDQQDRNYVSLRKDLETLASNADARLQSTRRQILELAGGGQNFGDPTN